MVRVGWLSGEATAEGCDVAGDSEFSSARTVRPSVGVMSGIGGLLA
jgi:hypothetical protein